jgi:hypothetical protein
MHRSREIVLTIEIYCTTPGIYCTAIELYCTPFGQRAKGTFAHDLKGYFFNSRGCPKVFVPVRHVSRPFKLSAQLLIPMNEEYIHLAREYIHEQQNLLRLSSFLNFNKKQPGLQVLMEFFTFKTKFVKKKMVTKVTTLLVKILSSNSFK